MPVILLVFALLMSSCASLFGGDSETAGTEITSPKPGKDQPKTTPIDALELRVAQLWSKVDDLETQLIQQKERSKLLEKALTLGIIPDELKAEDERPRTTLPAQVKSKAKTIDHDDTESKLQVATPPAPKVEGSHDREQYRKLLQAAQDKFNRANYGQAIVAYNDIGAKFDDSITEGSHHYWVGLSWFYLKEYKLSEESFSAFRERYPSSPWNNHAAFYLAKIEENRGLSQRALELFQKILDDNPDRDIGEMAKAEIQRMKEKL